MHSSFLILKIRPTPWDCGNANWPFWWTVPAITTPLWWRSSGQASSTRMWRSWATPTPKPNWRGFWRAIKWRPISAKMEVPISLRSACLWWNQHVDTLRYFVLIPADVFTTPIPYICNSLVLSITVPFRSITDIRRRFWYKKSVLIIESTNEIYY